MCLGLSDFGTQKELIVKGMKGFFARHLVIGLRSFQFKKDLALIELYSNVSLDDQTEQTYLSSVPF